MNSTKVTSTDTPAWQDVLRECRVEVQALRNEAEDRYCEREYDALLSRIDAALSAPAAQEPVGIFQYAGAQVRWDKERMAKLKDGTPLYAAPQAPQVDAGGASDIQARYKGPAVAAPFVQADEPGKLREVESVEEVGALGAALGAKVKALVQDDPEKEQLFRAPDGTLVFKVAKSLRPAAEAGKEPSEAVKCECVGQFGPNPDCGRCGGDGTYERHRYVHGEERAWLIEAPDARWGTGYFWVGVAEYDEWGTIDRTVRFARKEDAERVINSMHKRDQQKYGRSMSYEACEHIWSAPDIQNSEEKK